MLLMTLRAMYRGWSLAVVLLLASAGVQAAKREADPGATLAPAVRIPVGPLGYSAPSAAYLNFRFAFTSLDFIDSGHLLFTFHSQALMQRLPGDPPDDNDQVIHAVVLEIATGKMLRQADWRMHDRERYLWALHDGKFLVRERSALFLTDAGLELHPYLTFDNKLEVVEVSPARKLLLLELEQPEQKNQPADAGVVSPPTLEPGEEWRHTKTAIAVLHPGEREVLAKGELGGPTVLPLFDDGFLDVLEGTKPKEWVVEMRPIRLDAGAAMNEVATVKSSCTPDMVPLSESVAMVQNCPLSGNGNAVSAISLAGKLLWHDLWEPRYTWGTFNTAENGSRFAYGSLETNRSIGAMDSFGEADVIGQPVGVFDTESGKLDLVRNATPILSGGRNFALSPDGSRFAILRDGAIEVYNLPPLPAGPPPAVQTAK
jgi:hypothetical protein